jgi:hypothetical protein
MVIWKHATVVMKGSVSLNFYLDCLKLDFTPSCDDIFRTQLEMTAVQIV